MGHDVREGEAPFDVEEAASIQATIGAAGLAWLMREKNGTPSSPVLQAAAAAGAAMSPATLFAALDATARLRRAMSLFYQTTDLILTPSAAALPWPKADTHPPTIDGQPVGPRGHAVFTAFANIAALPGLALPCAPSASGMPIGFQLVGAPASDAGLLALGGQYEAAFPWQQFAAGRPT